MREDHRTATAGLPISAGRAVARPSRMLIVVVTWGSCFTLIM
ncbi:MULTISPECIES: hypothetical protein [Nocardia]|nr:MULTISPECIES: hypothetical protein [Nocardia]